MVGEILDGELHASPRLASPHAHARMPSLPNVEFFELARDWVCEGGGGELRRRGWHPR
jgi:hypothetical protein